MKLKSVQPDIGIGSCGCCSTQAARQVNIVTSTHEDVPILADWFRQCGITVVTVEDRLCIVILAVCSAHSAVMTDFIAYVRAQQKEITLEGMKQVFSVS